MAVSKKAKNPSRSKMPQAKRAPDAEEVREVIIVRREHPERTIRPESPSDLFGPNWYRTNYGNQLPQGMDPFEHYMETGWRSGLMPNIMFDPKWYFETHMSGEPFTNPLVHYCEIGAPRRYGFNCIVDVDYLYEQYGDLGCSALLFLLTNKEIDRISPWFSRSEYMRANVDLDGWERNAETHFMLHGLHRGRAIANGVRAEAKSGRGFVHSRDARVYEKLLAEFRYDGRDYAVVRQFVSEEILRQISNQAKIEPDVASVGHLAVPHLPQFRASEVNRRNLIDYRELLKAAPVDCDAIVVLPALQLGGAERYAANLIWGLQQNGLHRCVLLTTDAFPSDDRHAQALHIFSRLRGVHIASTREMLRQSWQPDTILALVLQRTRAKHLFVINSDLGLQTVRSHGKALSTKMSISCAFFSESPHAVGAPYSVRYLTDLLPFTKILSDNNASIDKWKERYNQNFDNHFVVVPSLIDDISDRTYRILSRSNVELRSENSKRILWFSRWEKFKAVDVLKELADLLPDTDIVAYGSVDSSFNKAELPRNLTHKGVMSNIDELALETFGVFVFTSYFEGLPNSVLEMAHRGVPIVASDVGGLRETFANKEIELVSMDGTPEEIAARFAKAIERVQKLSDEALLRRLDLARKAVERRHGTQSFIQSVSKLLERE